MGMANPLLDFVDLGLGPYVHGTPSKRFPVYTRGNSGEVYPEVVYPLSTSLPGLINGDPFTDSVRVIGAMTEKELQEEANIFGGVFGGYTYINLSASRVIAVRTAGTTVEETDATYLGSENLAPPHEIQRGDRNLWCSIKMVLYALSVLFGKKLSELEEGQKDALQWHEELPDFTTASEDELLNVFLDSVPLQIRLFRDHLLITGGAGIGLGLLKSLCKNKLGDESLALPMLGGIGDVESAAPSFALWELSRLIRNSSSLSACFDAGLNGLEDRLKIEPEAKEFNKEFKEFLKKFGSRGPNEWEIACEVWGTNPHMPLTIIDRMRQADDSRAPNLRTERLAKEREEAVRSAKSNLSRILHSRFDRFYECAVNYSQAREKSKTVLIDMIHQCRLALRELGQRVSQRSGGEVDDLWFIRLEEMDTFLQKPETMKKIISERKATREALSELVPPFCFSGELPPIETWEKRKEIARTALKPGEILEGIPGCAGKAKGIARIVLDPSEPGDIGPGDVLIAPHTDPSWTPLFVPVEAVIVNVGGQMSHAVIVSRELGLPCVVSVTDATHLIPDGSLVEVDGQTGTVTILETNEIEA